MATNVHLTPELARFAQDCVASGRFNNVSEVVRAGLRLLHDGETRRQEFTAMIEAVRREADRDGVHDVDDVVREMARAAKPRRK